MENKSKTKYYTVDGFHNAKDDDGYPIIDDKKVENVPPHECCAYEKNNKYYIKYIYGSDIYDPVETPPNKLKKQDRGLDTYMYMKASHDKFELYKDFLRTKNKKFYEQARRIINVG